MPQAGDSEEKGDCSGRDPPWGVSSSSHILGAPILESNTGKMSSPWLVGGPLTLTSGLWEARTPLGRRLHALTYILCSAERVTETTRVADWFPMTPRCVPRPKSSERSSPLTSCCSSTLEWGLPWQRKELDDEAEVGRPEVVCERREGSHYWRLTQTVHQKQPRRLSVAGLLQPAPITYREPPRIPLAPALLPSGARVPLLGRVRAHTKATEPAWTQTSRLLLQQLGSHPCPL